MGEVSRTAAEVNTLEDTTRTGNLKQLNENDDPHITQMGLLFNRMSDLLGAIVAPLEVFKDGDLTFGVREGKYTNGSSIVSYAGADDQALTDNDTNYIYLTATGTLVVNLTGYPVISTTPHIPLATVVTVGGAYDIDDITDDRGRAFIGTLVGTQLSAGEAVALAAAPLTATVTPFDDADGTGSADIEFFDAGDNTFSGRVLARVWVADAEFSEPDAQTGFTVDDGELMRTVEPNADLEIIRSGGDLMSVDIDTGGAKTVYVMVEFDGRIFSGEVVITV